MSKTHAQAHLIHDKQDAKKEKFVWFHWWKFSVDYVRTQRQHNRIEIETYVYRQVSSDEREYKRHKQRTDTKNTWIIFFPLKHFVLLVFPCLCCGRSCMYVHVRMYIWYSTAYINHVFFTYIEDDHFALFFFYLTKTEDRTTMRKYFFFIVDVLFTFHTICMGKQFKYCNFLWDTWVFSVLDSHIMKYVWNFF